MNPLYIVQHTLNTVRRHRSLWLFGFFVPPTLMKTRPLPGRHRSLWLFGFFVAGAGGGGAAPHAHGVSRGGSLPSWVVAAGIAAALVGVAGLVLRVVSEAALIDGVRRALLEALAEIDARDRWVVCLRHGGELEASEVAEITGLSTANVRKICERQRKRLLERLGEFAGTTSSDHSNRASRRSRASKNDCSPSSTHCSGASFRASRCFRSGSTCFARDPCRTPCSSRPRRSC